MLELIETIPETPRLPRLTQITPARYGRTHRAEPLLLRGDSRQIPSCTVETEQVVEVNHVPNVMLHAYKDYMLEERMRSHSGGNVIVQITMSKLTLTLIQHILGVMQETASSQRSCR